MRVFETADAKLAIYILKKIITMSIFLPLINFSVHDKICDLDTVAQVYF